MRVLITGHLGYVGPWMIRAFKEAGHHVTGLDVGYFRECVEELDGFTPPDRERVRDVRDVSAADLEDVEAIVHLAALSNDPLGHIDPALTHAINTEASLRLAGLAKSAGIRRFVFASSCSIYGGVGDKGAPADEQATMDPLSAYARSKVDTEAGLAALADRDFEPVFMRNATAFGVSPRMRFDLVVQNLIGWGFTTGVIRVLSDGTPWRPIVHIADMARACVAAVTAPAATVAGQAFNVGRDDNNFRIREIAETVVGKLPSVRLEITGEAGADPRSYRVSFAKAASALPGFQAEWTLDRGCDEIIEWLRAGHLREHDFQSRFFVRLKQLQHLMAERFVDEEIRVRAPA
ncbi:UDP-glucose 4-epimerase [Thalassobaculum fulvum]|uniref:UDP-glucose 4-epimerase n=1 Tax=Thalassobaculum fulvum TaxID=1633335 RepID=A0A918XT40_9PROT|nr:NAD(P)-dependent oxidoreductase [Thalassobaculum fulvum]GHD49951.1 UDP-glucose 4-epimerase [Thalassobaculum fulvum]